ncbi:acyltransferase [Tolypothrix sp. FACHB-123]|uniref:acyltransferase family protein n=1 Tax=Tolypothrix sp. FACHB-123 TaxID=2692868 RepID=UPI001683D15B|nr:acyltransferase [Tolypothrix sp. FACHB-123]MBD2357546.1 acyltransferase [Tolypothrix sp. FACHB-123]
MTAFSNVFNPKSNSLGFIRFVAAILVIFTHCFPLGGFDQKPLMIFNEIPGSIAVEVFFILSGFLITSSYLKSTSLIRYAWHRFLRIYPGLWICLSITAIIICPLVIIHTNDGSLGQYFATTNNSPFTYIYANLFNPRKQIGISNIFEANPWPIDLNGSLWTLWLEVICYTLVPFLGIIGFLSKKKDLFLFIFCLIFAIYILQIIIPSTNYWFSSLPYLAFYAQNGINNWKNKRLVLYFMSGSLFFLYKDKVDITSKPLVVIVSILIFLGITVLPHDLICVFAFPYLIFWLAVHLPFNKFEKALKGDYSYGLYIYSYPIQQTLTSFKLNHYSFSIYFMMSLFFTLAVSIASWHLIEKPCLSMKNIQFTFLKK